MKNWKEAALSKQSITHVTNSMREAEYKLEDKNGKKKIWWRWKGGKTDKGGFF